MRPNFWTIGFWPAAIGIASAGAVLELPHGTSLSTTPPPTVAISMGRGNAGDARAAHGTGALSAQAYAPIAAANSPVAQPPAEKKEEAAYHDPWGVTLLGKIAWPLAFLVALVLLGFVDRLRRILGFSTKLIRKISAGGVEIEINSETVQLVQRELHGTFDELVKGAGEEYERLSEVLDVPELLKHAIARNLQQGHQPAIPNLRGTVHVRDVIFPEYLYQLVDYYPSGGGSDRRFSQRYGIIGRSWRMKKSDGKGNAFQGGGGSIDALVENWGMTQEEAQGQVNARPACLSVLLRHKSVAIGVLFIDSTDENAFGDDASARAMANKLETAPGVADLAEAVFMVLKPLKTAAPSLHIGGPRR